jgi:organic radical activating enzyme
MSIKIVEIFKSIEGEGSLIGFSMVFIRLEGCNLRCPWCDTKYSYDGSSYKSMNIKEIREAVEQFSTKNITITGGEPLGNDGFDDIVRVFEDDYFVKIETNGTLFKSSLENRNLYISCSPKEPYFIDEKLAPFIDELKFVIDDKIEIDDINRVLNMVETTNVTLQPQSYDLVNSLKKAQSVQDRLAQDGVEARLIPQTHKLLNID